ncbi:MAG: hypothetical protein SynsKO_41990 [Synoicihabitans sp.]
MAFQLSMGTAGGLVCLSILCRFDLNSRTSLYSGIRDSFFLRLTVATLLMGPLIVHAQDTEEAFGGATVALPPFYVEPRDGENWTRVQADGFELITTHDRTFARQFVQSYLVQTHLVNQFVPERYRWQPHTPDTFVAVDQKSNRLSQDDAIMKMLERNRENYESTNTRGNFLPNLRLISVDSSVNFAFLNQSDLGSGRAGSRASVPGERFIVPGNPQPAKGFRFSPNRLSQQLNDHTLARPLWAISGLVDLYNRSEFTRGRVSIDPYHGSRTDPDRIPFSADDLERLLISPPPSTETGRLRWQKHAELLVQWCLFAENGKNRDKFWGYLDHTVVRPPSEAAFTQFMNMSFAETALVLEDYYQEWGHRRVRFTPPSRPPRGNVKVSAAKRVDVVRILAEWERLEAKHINKHFPELRETYLERARKTIASARHNHVDSPELAAVAGLLEFEADNLDVAREELTRAVEAGVDRPSVLQALAQVELDALLAGLDNAESPTPELIKPIADLLIRAHNSAPQHVAIYTNLAEVWGKSGQPLAVDDIAILAKGVRSFPRNLQLVTQLAQMQAHRGNLSTAVSILNFAADRAASEKIQQTLQNLVETMEKAAVEIAAKPDSN